MSIPSHSNTQSRTSKKVVDQMVSPPTVEVQPPAPAVKHQVVRDVGSTARLIGVSGQLRGTSKRRNLNIKQGVGIKFHMYTGT